MDRKELEEMVVKYVATSYKKDAGDITLATSFKDDLGGSSLQMVSLTALIENELDAMVPLKKASAAETVADLVDLVEEDL